MSIKKIVILFFVLLAYIESARADLHNDIIPNNTPSSGENYDTLDSILGFVRDGIFSLLSVIAIGVFLFLGFKLAIARGNPEEFKKAINMFIYAIVGLFVIMISYAAVRLVTGLNIQ